MAQERVCGACGGWVCVHVCGMQLATGVLTGGSQAQGVPHTHLPVAQLLDAVQRVSGQEAKHRDAAVARLLLRSVEGGHAARGGGGRCNCAGLLMAGRCVSH
jgi:hypothetical protein